MRRLAAASDVLVENFRPGVMGRLGLDYPALRAVNPRLIYCSISGYGQTGPAADRAGYAMIVHAQSGFDRTLMHYAGDRTRPAPQAVFVGDVLGGIFGFGAIQTALLRRARTGEGEHIDLALMDSMLNLLVYEMQEAQFPQSTRRIIYGPLRARDGDVLITPVTERNYIALAEVTGIAALRTDSRFATYAARAANWVAMMALVEEWTALRTIDECQRELEAAGVPCGRYNDPGDAYNDPHLQARGVFTPVADGAGEFLGVNIPWRSTAAPASIGARVPRIGEHNEEILRQVLGMDAPAIRQLTNDGTFGAPTTPNAVRS